MSRRLLLSLALVATGAALLAGGAGAKTGGTLVYDNQGDFQFMDPQISYYNLDWTVLQSTCVKLLNWPDANGPKAAQLQPEAATGFPRVSNGGKTYDFNVDVPWTKFYPGNAPVNAQSFKNAFDRIMDPKMQSPAAQFTDDVATVAVRGKHLVTKVRCPKSASRCRGELAGKAGKVKLGHDDFDLVAGAGQKLKLRLSKKARNKLADHALKAKLIATAADANGDTLVTKRKARLKRKR